MEEKEFNMEKFSETVLKLHHNKQILRDFKEENDLLKEDIEEMFRESGVNEITVQLSAEEYIVVSPSVVIKESLDKDALAETLQIDKNEMKKPWDFAKLAEKFIESEEFTAEGVTMSSFISRYTVEEPVRTTKISKRKHKKKRRSGQLSNA